MKRRLFKQYAAILEKTAYRYKRSEGKRWVSVHVEALKVHLENLPVTLTFTNEQVELPYNATMQKEKSRPEGIRREACDLKLLIYQAIRCGITRYTVSCSLALESASLLVPEAITQIESAIRSISKLATVVSNEGISTLKKSELYPTLNKEVIPKLTAEQNSLVPAEMTLRKQANEMSNQHPVVFCGNTMRGGYCRLLFG